MSQAARVRPAELGPEFVSVHGAAAPVVARLQVDRSRSRASAADYLALLKPRVTSLVMMTAWAGAFIATDAVFSWTTSFHALIGTGLVAGGTAGLNQVIEYKTDALMRRTMNRPVAAGRLGRAEAGAFSFCLVAIGLVYLGVEANWLSAMVAGLTSALYLLAYTPLKLRSQLSTTVGAIPGAMPVLIGWAAARGSLGTGAWVLFAIQFLWQFPHFLAIGWLYREDYRRAGIRMLPVVDRTGRATGYQIVIYSLALLPVVLLPTLLEMAGGVYFYSAMVLTIALVLFGVNVARSRTTRAARQLLRASVLYLPALLVMMMLY